MASAGNKAAVVVFGNSGNGKSRTVNEISGENKCVVGDNESSETDTCTMVHVDRPNSIFHGQNLLDMQGFNDSRIGHNTQSVFQRANLFFLQSQIATVQCIIFVVSLLDRRTNFYDKFAEYLGAMFTRDHVKRNSLVLLTQGDELQLRAKEKKIENIKHNVSALNDDCGWNMRIVEWSNNDPLPDQEWRLLEAMSHYDGFDIRDTLAQMDEEIDRQAQLEFESDENKVIVKHEAKFVLRESLEAQQVDDYAVLGCEEAIRREIPAETVVEPYSTTANVLFRGAIREQTSDGFLFVKQRVNFDNITQHCFRDRLCQREEQVVTFVDPVVEVSLNKSKKDIHLLDNIDAMIDPEDRRKVTVVAEFSWSGSVVETWDFYVKVSAQLERTRVIKARTEDIVVLHQNKLEKVQKTVTKPVQKNVEVEPAREEIIWKRSLEQICQDIIRQRLANI